MFGFAATNEGSNLYASVSKSNVAFNHAYSQLPSTTYHHLRFCEGILTQLTEKVRMRFLHLVPGIPGLNPLLTCKCGLKTRLVEVKKAEDEIET